MSRSSFGTSPGTSPMMACPLTDLLNQTRRPKILVVGDVMLDRYLWGDVERISPEAPIPVLKVDRREDRLGGAGSVVSMLAALESDVILAAALADDAEAAAVRRLLGQLGVADDAVLVAPGRCTTVKERFLGRTQCRHPQQMIRVDREQTAAIDDRLTRGLLGAIGERLDDIDVVLVSDYDKGVCGGRLVVELAKMAQPLGIPVLADPARAVDYRRYAGCTSLAPNRTEAGLALGRRIDTIEAGLEAARELLAFGLESAVVKLDRDGIAWADVHGHRQLFPTRARQVYDVTGAGDMVLAALGYALGSGVDWPTAIELANLAAGLEVERLGVTPVSRRELLAEFSHGPFSTDHKVVSLEELLEQLAERRRLGQRIAMTNGCYDLLHPGHVASLQHARNQGDCLVVGLNSDQSVRSLKGPCRPVVDQQGRAEMVAALACVDYVVIFDESSVAGLVECVGPDVLVKAAEYAPEEVVGYQAVERRGGRVVLAPMKGQYSTSHLINRILEVADHKPRKAEDQ